MRTTEFTLAEADLPLLPSDEEVGPVAANQFPQVLKGGQHTRISCHQRSTFQMTPSRAQITP